MTRPAIIFENVSKRYRLHHQKKQGSGGLWESLARLNPFKRMPATVAEGADEDFWALKDVSFEIMPGESVGIIGPNGSGKSTSLKILSGVTKPTSGRFELNGKLGALLEVGAGFHPDLTGRENVFLNGSILGMSKKEIRRKFDAIVDFAEIEQFIDTPVKHYSSGMYVRLGFAVAIHNEPEIMLVDEALAVGDLSFQKKCFARMEALKNEGRTFILVTHAMAQVQELCARAILINKGQVMLDGESAAVSGKYIALMEQHSKHAQDENGDNQAKQASIQLEITGIHLLDENGEPANAAEIGVELRVRIDYTAIHPIKGVCAVINVTRNDIAIYRANSGMQNVYMDIPEGNGSIFCKLPGLSLIPNEYDFVALLWNTERTQIFSRRTVKAAFTIKPPHDLYVLECGLPLDPTERSLVFGHTQWFYGPAN
jgi:lipopolysaccharide transport system ATP-binding protein